MHLSQESSSSVSLSTFFFLIRFQNSDISHSEPLNNLCEPLSFKRRLRPTAHISQRSVPSFRFACSSLTFLGSSPVADGSPDVSRTPASRSIDSSATWGEERTAASATKDKRNEVTALGVAYITSSGRHKDRETSLHTTPA